MPWLIKDENPENNLLFVHVPRCGGTSLTKLYKVRSKALKNTDPYHKFGMLYFFYRYRLLENANFPVISIENCIAILQIVVATLMYTLGEDGSMSCKHSSPCVPNGLSIFMWLMGCLSLICSTFLFTAPVSARNDIVRRIYAILVGKVLCELTASYKTLTGVGFEGYIVHFTAGKMIEYGHVPRPLFEKSNTFAIVRNPFTRMVSIYMYNRFGPLESFEHFVETWYVKWQQYQAKRSTHEWDVYCHVLPQHEYTHMKGKQIVKSVILQEDLKAIVTGTKTTCLVDDRRGSIPDLVLNALKAMPHANKRKRDKPWQDYYNERTVQLVRTMYESDFLIFGYDLLIPGRPDLDIAGWQADKVVDENRLSDGTSTTTFADHSDDTGSLELPPNGRLNQHQSKNTIDLELEFPDDMSNSSRGSISSAEEIELRESANDVSSLV